MGLYKGWQIREMTGYEPMTTFWEDFTIAEAFGMSAVEDTFRRAFEEWKSNYKYLTELVMVLNWKMWTWWHVNDELSLLYNNLWAEADDYACDNLKGEELTYFYDTVD